MVVVGSDGEVSELGNVVDPAYPLSSPSHRV